MRINSTDKINIYRSTFRQSIPIKPCSISFKSCDFLDLPKDKVLKQIEESIIPENFLGHGTEAEVYKIKNTNYCVRIPHYAKGIKNFNYSKELSPFDKVNHIVAKLGFGASIMKHFEGVIPKWFMDNNHSRYELQKAISEMPVKSYSELLHQIANAIDNEMLFDFSPGNLVVNTEKQKLTAIDFYNISENPRPVRPLSEMYSVLTCYGSLKSTGKKIFDNIIDAGLEEFKPNTIPCMDVELFDFVDLARKRNSDNHSYRQGSITEHINEFYKIMNNISECFKELKQIKKQEIIDKKQALILINKITNFKNLIKGNL